MTRTQHQEALRVETTRGGRCNFSFGKPQREELARVLSAKLQENPARFSDNTPHLVERLKEGLPMSQGDAVHLVRLHAHLPELSMSADAALRAAATKLEELSNRHHQKFLRTRHNQSSDDLG